MNQFLASHLLFLWMCFSVSAEVTFSKDIAGIIYDHCVECHSPNTAAPFSLISYKDVSKRAKTIANVIADGYMPPWHPVKGYGSFKDERGLTDREISLFSDWIDAGKPIGLEDEIPSLPTLTDGWSLGQPDLIVQMPKGFKVPADGRDIYRSFVIPLDLKEDKWVKAIEIMPSARTVVHHCLYWMDDSGRAIEIDGEDGRPGFRDGQVKGLETLGTWAVGAQSKKLHADYAMPLPKGSDIVLSTHFHPSGKEEVEQTTIGVYFSDKPSSKKVVEMQVPGFYGRLAGLVIPPGKSDFVLRGKMTLPMDIEILTASAHMHYLGTSAKGWATLPDGRVENLLYIDEWDFNWQGSYHYREPVFLPKGTILESEIHYDNSSNNPFNPHDPPQMVRWGLESEDEMGSLIYLIVPHDEKDNQTVKPVLAKAMREASKKTIDEVTEELTYENIVKKFDQDGNGTLQLEEFPKKFKRFLLKVDRNKNGTLEENELKRIQPHIAKIWDQL